VVRNFLGGFGFQGDRAFECIEHFSGGEKARLALSILAWQEPNLLLLDEPTNHLDLEVRQALTHALQMYEGAVLLVSHDRHLLKNTVDEFYLVDEGAVHVFDGDLEDYQKSLNTKDKSSSSSISKSADTNLKKSTSEIKKDKKERRQQAAEHREKLKPLRSSLKKNEQNMMRFETQLAELEVSLADSSVYYDVNKEKLQSLIEDRAKVQKNIDMLEVEWLALTEDIEKYQ